jgi:hypothetical protein
MDQATRSEFHPFVWRAVKKVAEALITGEREFNIAKAYGDHRVFIWRVNQKLLKVHGNFLVYEPWNVQPMCLFMRVKLI